jgi:hypothetical protein
MAATARPTRSRPTTGHAAMSPAKRATNERRGLGITATMDSEVRASGIEHRGAVRGSSMDVASRPHKRVDGTVGSRVSCVRSAFEPDHGVSRRPTSRVLFNSGDRSCVGCREQLHSLLYSLPRSPRRRSRSGAPLPRSRLGPFAALQCRRREQAQRPYRSRQRLRWQAHRPYRSRQRPRCQAPSGLRSLASRAGTVITTSG